MYKDMLVVNNKDFENAIDRGIMRHKTKRLHDVVKKLRNCQSNMNAPNLTCLLNNLHAWRTTDPKEYNNRGGTRGVAYRLWMEAKQMLLNKFQGIAPHNDPPAPAAYPGDTILGTYVPPDRQNPQMEICHGFTYRWLIARGNINETISAANSPFNDGMENILFPGGRDAYQPARAGGVLQVQPGDLVGFFATEPQEPQQFAHSLIVVDQNTWFGANNQGCFGLGTGRKKVNFVAQPWAEFQQGAAGWQGNGNRWLRPTGGNEMQIVYRRF
jgi:hypothetical protein